MDFVFRPFFFLRPKFYSVTNAEGDRSVISLHPLELEAAPVRRLEDGISSSGVLVEPYRLLWELAQVCLCLVTL